MKREKSKTVLSGLIVLLVAVLALGSTPARAQGIGQFLSGEEPHGEFNIHNSDEFEYLAIVITYNANGTLARVLDNGGACRAVLIPPHGNDGNQYDTDVDSADHWEVIAIPTEGQHAGVFDVTETLGLGVHVNLKKQHSQPTVPAALYAPPESEEDQGLLEECICCELDELGLPANALQGAFGFTCPAPSQVICDDVI